MSTATKTTDRLVLQRLFKAWRQRFFDVTFEFTAASQDAKDDIARRIGEMARSLKLKKIAFQEMCVADCPVVEMMTYHCGDTPKGVAQEIMRRMAKVQKSHPTAEFHFRFVTRI